MKKISLNGLRKSALSKSIRLLFVVGVFFLLSPNLFSDDYKFKCENPLIPDYAKGTYTLSTDGKFYYSTSKTESYDILADTDLGDLKNVSKLWTDSSMLYPNGENLTAFDEYGNLFFWIRIGFSAKDKKDVYAIGVVKYNPEINKSVCIFEKEAAYPVSFCISDDGKWVFPAIHQFNNDTNYYYGYSYVYAVPVVSPKDAEVIWSPYYDYPHGNGLYNICFDSNIQAVYFNLEGWNYLDDCSNGDGFYRLKADQDGNYKARNLERLNYLIDYFYNKLMDKTEQTKDYQYLAKAFKDKCGANINPADIEINLSYFKDVSDSFPGGAKYKSLYRTDAEGKVLKEDDALAFLIENRKLFDSFIKDYNSARKRNYRCIPLDTICFKKGTHFPAFDYDAYKEFFDTYASTCFGYVYSNADGLWGVYNIDDGNTSSEIYHLTDNKGNFLGTQENGLDTVKLTSKNEHPKPFFISENSMTMLDVTRKKIYHYEDGILSTIIPENNGNKTYKYEDVKQIADKYAQIDIQQKLEKSQVKTEIQIKEVPVEVKVPVMVSADSQKDDGKIDQETVDKLLAEEKEQFTAEIAELNDKNHKIQTDLDSAASELETSKNRNRLYLILLSIFIVLCVIFLIILIVNFMLQTKKINEIKKNKRFIFDIQEKERAKISRDIHDSVIQDIRSIRIEAELIKAAEDTEGRKESVIKTATECVVKLRNICYNLTPAELMTHEQGDSSRIELISIIQSLVLQFIERTHVPCQLKIDENFEYPVFSKEISQNLFRIIQEALNNIEKHSYATNCQILIKNKTENEKKYMLIYVSDDGIGCNIEQILKRNKKNHFGLQNMMDRAELIGAKIDFQSEQGQGMEVRIQI